MDLFKTYRSIFGANLGKDQAEAETGLKFEVVQFENGWIIEPVTDAVALEQSSEIGLVAAVRAYATRMTRRYNWDQTWLITDEELLSVIKLDGTPEQAIKAVYAKFVREVNTQAPRLTLVA